MIDRVVHVVWIGPAPFPYGAYLDSWSAHNPGWDVRFWTDTNRPHLGECERVYEAIPHRSGKVNVLRLFLLAEFGGVYSDADSECLRPLDTLVGSHSSFGMTGRHGNVQNATLGCVRGDETFSRMVADIPSRFDELKASKANRARGVTIWSVFGTRYITPHLRSDPGFFQVDSGCVRGGRSLICEREEQNPETYVVHDQAATWFSELGARRVRL